jgi:hypothetical protein
MANAASDRPATKSRSSAAPYSHAATPEIHIAFISISVDEFAALEGGGIVVSLCGPIGQLHFFVVHALVVREFFLKPTHLLFIGLAVDLVQRHGRSSRRLTRPLSAQRHRDGNPPDPELAMANL